MVGKTVCKMQTFVFPTVFYIWKVLLICRGGYYPPASKDTNIVIEINYIILQSYCYFVGENRVLPFVCIVHDCTHCVQN
mgnify:CR=1 FL=1|jgi:hypothetical protein